MNTSHHESKFNFETFLVLKSYLPVMEGAWNLRVVFGRGKSYGVMYSLK